MLAEASGFEPNLTESKSVVLTRLHHAPTKTKNGGGWKNRTTWQPPYLTMPTGLQPAIGNNLRKLGTGTRTRTVDQ
jgi:hypothetical protein